MIFYMGLTTGIILGTTLPSYLNELFGWSASFLSAFIGMMMAIGVFSWGIYQHRIEDYHPYVFNIKSILQAAFMMAVLWVASFYILNDPRLADSIFCAVALFSIGYFFYCVKGESAAQSRQTIALGMLCLISVMFWAFYFQMFLSFTLFIARGAAYVIWYTFSTAFLCGFTKCRHDSVRILPGAPKKTLKCGGTRHSHRQSIFMCDVFHDSGLCAYCDCLPDEYAGRVVIAFIYYPSIPDYFLGRDAIVARRVVRCYLVG